LTIVPQTKNDFKKPEKKLTIINQEKLKNIIGYIFLTYKSKTGKDLLRSEIKDDLNSTNLLLEIVNGFNKRNPDSVNKNMYRAYMKKSVACFTWFRVGATGCWRIYVPSHEAC